MENYENRIYENWLVPAYFARVAGTPRRTIILKAKKGGGPKMKNLL